MGLLLNNRKSETMYSADQAQVQLLRDKRLDHIVLHYKATGELHEHEFPFGKGNGKKMQKYASCVISQGDNQAGS